MHNKSEKNIATVFILNLVFTIIEVFGGIITNSTAILSDAVHDLGDTFALGTSLIFQRLSRKLPTEKYTFGFKRLTVIGALINVIILTIGSLFILVETFKKLSNPTAVVSEVMIIISIFGILANGISFIKMKSSNKVLDKTIMLHLMEDFLGWIVTFIVSILIFVTDLYILDPLLSIFIFIIIIKNIYRSGINIIEILLNSNPNLHLSKRIKEKILNTKGVIKILDYHFWSEDGDEYNLAIVIKSNNKKILNKIKKILIEENINHSIVEIN